MPADGSLPPEAVAELSEASFGVYVHVPFCRTRCGYCDFNTYTPSELTGMSPQDYRTALLAELELADRVLGEQRPRVSTVFFGGGTPTMLPAAELVGLLDALRERFGLAEDAEITTEANPETVDRAYLAELRAGGFTRVSLGMQSVVPHVLATLERSHTPGRGLEVAHWAAEAGFEHISLDLIFGAPGESEADWQASLDAVAVTPVDHVSAYSLIVEEGTRLALKVRRGEIAMPDEDDLATKYLMAEEFLTGHGFTNYETSNWARPGGECRHNLAYWRGGNWWGFGPGAHSHVSGVRFWNRRHPRSHAAELAAGRSPAQARELLGATARRLERIMLELRLAEGLPWEVLDAAEQERAAEVVAEGLAERRGDRLVLTLRGRLLADGVVLRLLG
ncbi:MAG: radical SAM family heme chaperone HemW [Propionibacteriaceae bacterium]|nr:radical SAM family heme chaperone HemW [Propionibacteriaceae bacterium]